MFIIIFVMIFVIVIVIIKDLLDIEGDLKYKIEMFFMCFGVKKVFYIGLGLLFVNYIFVIVFLVKNFMWFI